MLLILPGCGVLKDEVHVGLKRPVEVTKTPFYPQEKHQCGPASLAMVLGASGVHIHPDTLVSRIYLPGRKGSLQPELISAARKYGRIPYVIDGTLPALIAEIKAGRPVLVLQNLGVELIPVYHYAVVVGADPANTIVLRSGTERRMRMDVNDFLETWQRSGTWGFVLLMPGELPAQPDPARYLKTVSSFEVLGNTKAATKAYRAAVSRWPKNQNAALALANNYLRQGKNDESERTLRALIAEDPDNIPALNNLSELLAQRECYPQALELINKALHLARVTGSPFRDTVQQTRQEIILQWNQGGKQQAESTCSEAPDES